MTYTIKKYCTHYYFTKVIFLFIFCNELMLRPKLLKHAEFNQFHLSLIDNHFSTYGYLILTSGPYNCSVVEVEGTSQIWP